MEQENLIYINIIISCFCSIFYLSRKYCNRGKQSRYTKDIIDQINSLGIGNFTIDNIVSEIQKILPVKIDDEKVNELNLNDIKLTVSQQL